MEKGCDFYEFFMGFYTRFIFFPENFAGGLYVAIKLLPPELAQDSKRLARFERKAKLLASMNHPNIAAVFGLEESDGRNFLVLELAEGEILNELDAARLQHALGPEL